MKEIYDLASESVKINNLQDRIELLNMDVKDLDKVFETDTFDLITCNPPYFRTNNVIYENDNNIKSLARHEKTLVLEDIFKISKILLKSQILKLMKEHI